MPQQRVFTFAYLSVRSSSTPLRWLSSVTSIFSWQRANGHVQSRREPEGTVVILHKPSRLCIPVGNPYHTYSKLNPQAGARFRKKKCEDWYWLKPATKIRMTYLHDNHDNDDDDMGDLQSGLPTAALCSALQLATLLHSYLPFWSFAELVGGDMMRYAMQKSAVE